MTEQEWLASTDPAAMHKCVTQGFPVAGKSGVNTSAISGRKLRLFACACCRLRGVGTDSVIDGYEKTGGPRLDGGGHLTDLRWAQHWTEIGVGDPALRVRAAILRDICGNPWRTLTSWIPKGRSVRSCDYGTVLRIAKFIYDSRDFDSIPILADALEDAGCRNEEILNHCRGLKPCLSCCGRGGEHLTYEPTDSRYYKPCKPCGGQGWTRPVEELGESLVQHFRGCWVLDLILGKE